MLNHLCFKVSGKKKKPSKEHAGTERRETFEGHGTL